jgi:hypothetical protein
MNPITQFREWLDEVVRNLRRKALARGFATVAMAALLATIALAAYSNRMAFSERSLFWSRIALVTLLGISVAFAIIVPLLSINRRRVLRSVERKFPQFEQRAMTVADSPEGNPFVQLLAAETMREVEQVPPARMVGSGAIWGMSLAGLAGAAALVWLTTGAPGPLGHGASLLWAGTGRAGTQDYYRIAVEPGDRKVRRGSDQGVTAKLIGFDAQPVILRARSAGAAKWDELSMEPNPGGEGYSFLLAGLNESIEYQVISGRVRSQVHRLTVVDLPVVKHIRVTYRFPAWAGARNVVEDPGGDLRAVEGTGADLIVTTDRPASNALLVFDDGTRIPLAGSGELKLTASVDIRKDGSYYVAAMDGGDEVRISDDYFVEAMRETPPVVKVLKPGRDAKVSPIEEVKVEVTATDDFALEQVELRYSVNGGEEKTAPLLARKGMKEAGGRHLIALEDYKLEPGDIVALYAQARDARNTTRTDVYFLETQPYEKEYSQSQVTGGGGEGGQREAQISQRQKEIIAATWNELRGAKSMAAQREDSKFLAEVQEKLSMQAKSLANRMRSRQLAGANDEFTKFVSEMEQASAAMTEAVLKLKSMKWKEALPCEQRALQQILRGEALFKQIQVAFGQQQGGGGMGGGENRDLESLFDLELDTEKNQYEASDSAQSNSRDAAVDEALKRLEDLARRQQQLAQQQQSKQQQFQQRWQQEMLRREAEELRRKMEELAQSQRQSSSQQPGNPSSEGQQSRSLRQMASGGAAGDPRVQRAKEQLDKALEDMRRAAQGGGDPSSARRAAERMEEANSQLGSMRRQETSGKLGDLAERADKLAERQRRFEKDLKSSVGSQKPGQPAIGDTPGMGKVTNERLAAEKEQIGKEYERLERELQSATRAMAGTRRQAASKLREALGEAQQKELGLRLKFAPEWLKKGLGVHLAPRERVVTEALNRLSEQVEDAKKSAAGGSEDEQRERAERALESFERARAQLGQAVQPGGQGQPGKPGQMRDEKSQEGRASERNESPGSRSGAREYSNMNDGTRNAELGGQGSAPENRGQARGGAEQAWGAMMRELRSLRESTPAEDESRREIDDVLQRMQKLDPSRFPGNPTLLEALRQSVMPELEQLELRLRMQAGGGESGPIRSGRETRSPSGYEKAVAEYYRRLSQGK